MATFSFPNRDGKLGFFLDVEMHGSDYLISAHTPHDIFEQIVIPWALAPHVAAVLWPELHEAYSDARDAWVAQARSLMQEMLTCHHWCQAAFEPGYTVKIGFPCTLCVQAKALLEETP